MPGELTDTYVAALQHDIADVPESARLVGVVRTPTPWFHGAVDENRPHLGPPADLLEATKAREEELAARGVCEEEAHNAAWAEVEFEERYRTHLETDEGREAVADLLDALRAGEDVALVCYENTDVKRCHRTILREKLRARLD